MGKASNWLIIGGYFLLTIIYTYPLILHFNTQVIGYATGDNLEFIWKIWWVAHSLFDLKQSPMVLENINYPFGYLLAYGDLTIFNTFLLSPVTYIWGPIVTYNVSIYLSFLLSGFFTYLFVERLTKNQTAAFFAGFLFSFCNFRMARVGAHLNIMGTQWIPLFLYFVEKYISDLSWKNTIFIGVVFALAGYSTIYFPAMLVLIAPVYVVIRLLKAYGVDGLKNKWKNILCGAVTFVAISAILLFPSIYPYLEIQRSGSSIVTFDDITYWSADITNYLTPNPYQFVWKDWLITHVPVVFPLGRVIDEYVVGLSFVGVLFALYGFMTSRRNERAGWGWWFSSTFLLSLGPVMKLFNRLVTINVSPGLYQKFNSIIVWLGANSFSGEILHLGSSDKIPILLPGLFIRWFIPGFMGLRSWGRFSIFLMLGVAVWAGYGLSKFLSTETNNFTTSLKSKSKILLGVLLFIALFETYNGPQSLMTPGPRKVDSWLAAHDVQNPIIQMPFLSALSGPQLYYTQYHHHPIVGGYGMYLPLIFSRDYPELKEFPSDGSLDLLRDWGSDKGSAIIGVKYILVDEAEVSANDPLWEAIRQQHRMEEITVLDGVHVYSIRN